MASISRVTLPTEFYDRTSEIVLSTPLPEYSYARLLYAACARAELLRVGPEAFQGLGRGPNGAAGAAYPDASAFQSILNEDVRGDAILVSEELAKGPGHTIRMNRPNFTASGDTLADRVFSGAIDQTTVDLSDQQVSITIQKTKGRVHGISRLDAQRSVHSLAGRVGFEIANDRHSVVDKTFAQHFDAGTTVLYPGDSSNLLASDALAWPVVPSGSSRPFDLETLLRMEQALLDAKVPRFGNGRYQCFVTPKQARQLKADPQYQRQSMMVVEKNLLSLGGGAPITLVSDTIELMVSNSNIVDTATVAGVSINHAVMFGPRMCGYAPTAEGVRVAQASEDNFGEDVKVLWICYEGHAVLDNRFGVSAHSD